MQIQDLKIALVGPLPPPSGGMANQTRQLATLLKQEGVNVELVPVNAPYRPRFVGHIKGLRAVFRLLPYLFHLWHAAGRVDLFHIMANSGWSWHLFAAPAVWTAKLRGKTVSGIQARLGNNVRVELRLVDSIPPEVSGKYRYVVSHVPLQSGLDSALQESPPTI
ncbi:MAG: hypothetical protein DID90_2727553940 [Candidatus Nitrotoga sp. LAW]|nr:MAG: hypothetical protein DID90_2727553940 [Candidatus Nitrotoga sp. LAW]